MNPQSLQLEWPKLASPTKLQSAPRESSETSPSEQILGSLSWESSHPRDDRQRWELHYTPTPSSLCARVSLAKSARNLPRCMRVRSFAKLIEFRLLARFGFTIIRRSTESPVSMSDQKRLFCQLASGLGEVMMDQEQPLRASQVTTLGKNFLDLSHPRVTNPSSFRTEDEDGESPDFVGILCEQPALYGGEIELINGLSIHQRLARQEPSFLRNLSRRTMVSKEDRREPIFRESKGRNRPTFSLPEPDDSAKQCPDRRKFLAYSEHPEHQFCVELKAGDILFVNNKVLAHRTLQYADTPMKSRLIQKIWIKTGRAL